jgi:lactate dehydrogenase-like 2-hydroxyacid dehydrogenase
MSAAKPVVLVTRKLPAAVEERLRRDYRPRLNPTDADLDAQALIEGARGAQAILTSPVDPMPAGLIRDLPEGVRAIATFSVGYEHIDLQAARDRGITVTNTPDILTEATADIAMLCLLGAARRAFEAQTLLHAGDWRGWRPTQLIGLDLAGATLGIVGMGRIGRALAQRARGFGLTIHYHNRRRLPQGEEAGATYHETLEAMLPLCRFLSLNCPASPETTRLLDSRRLALLPEGAVVVNTARGGLVDDEALIAALRSGRLFAAGLDVFEGEPELHPGYLELPNVFLLPHLGSATAGTRDAMGFRCLDNLDAIFAGRPAPDALS